MDQIRQAMVSPLADRRERLQPQLGELLLKVRLRAPDTSEAAPASGEIHLVEGAAVARVQRQHLLGGTRPLQRHRQLLWMPREAGC